MADKSLYRVAFILVTSLFFLWAFLHNINPILIPHLKKACQLSDAKSALIDSAVYIGYFLAAIPAGWFMHKFGYKKGILFGLMLYAIGALLFIPAAGTRSYVFFLVALFIMASGATFLETVANPYITKLGDASTAAQRLNFAQSFNGVGAFIAPIIGGLFILSGVEHSSQELQAMDTSVLNAYLQTEADTVKIPYLIMGLAVLLVIGVFMFSKIPEFKEESSEGSAKFSLSVLNKKSVQLAVLAQFFYVGGQVGIGSFFIRYSKYVQDIPEKQAAFLWGSIAMVGFMLGRFMGTYLMSFIRPAKLLAIYSIVSAILITISIFTKGNFAVYTLIATPFFMSIMFPTIFSLGLEGLTEEESKMASAFLVMAIVGGAFIPVIMGYISDSMGGNIQISYIIPAICFLVVGFYGFIKHKQNKNGNVSPIKMTH
ncbi:MAG: L-fucose:H+ symporter permease [Saprospiraceae bacterium]|nr:L-fucose:H+ symporter permease [Saprospiraceae bacterium]MBK8634256.1 L-fucose:H+ symporter permease [Saprospiraceae bacterium]